MLSRITWGLLKLVVIIWTNSNIAFMYFAMRYNNMFICFICFICFVRVLLQQKMVSRVMSQQQKHVVTTKALAKDVWQKQVNLNITNGSYTKRSRPRPVLFFWIFVYFFHLEVTVDAGNGSACCSFSSRRELPVTNLAIFGFQIKSAKTYAPSWHYLALIVACFQKSSMWSCDERWWFSIGGLYSEQHCMFIFSHCPSFVLCCCVSIMFNFFLLTNWAVIDGGRKFEWVSKISV